METWQQTNITTNLFKLSKLIKCDGLLLAALQESLTLSEEDAAEVESRPDRYKMAKHLLEIVQTRTNGYESLLQALYLTEQTGALEVVLNSVSESILDDFKVILSGRTFGVASVLTSDQRYRLWLEIRGTYDLSEFLHFLCITTKQNKEITVKTDTIPTALPYYIPRTLSKRLHINPEIFKQDCDDVFVIQGIERLELSELTNNQLTAHSSNQLEEITVRFIKLANREQWEDLITLSKSPIHLINYEAERESFVLEDTSGDSKIIQHYMENRHPDDITITEDQLLDEVDTNINNGMCICDLPGMGKTQVLANLARKVSRDSNKVVLFIRLQHFVLTIKSSTNEQANNNPESQLLQHITKTRIGAHIAQYIFRVIDKQFHIFFDGFDEINSEDVTFVKQFLQGLTTKSYITLYVTSRSHMRNELEDSLGVLAYDILPFSMENQINFLTKYWNNKYPDILVSRLESFAQLCLRKFKDNMSSDKRDIAGIPIQCRLIADVYERSAIRFSKTDTETPEDQIVTFGKSLAEIYTKFVDNNFSTDNLSSVESPEPSNLNITLRHELRYLALKEVFPRFMFLGQDPVEKSSFKNENKHILSVGLLEEIHNGKNVVLQFIHRTVAEYLVAEFIVEHLLNEVSLNKSSNKNFLNKVLCALKSCKHRNVDFCSFLFGTVFKVQISKSSFTFLNVDSFCFTYSTVIFFFDHLLKSIPASQYSEIALTIMSTPGPKDIYNIITSSGLQNLVNIFSLIESICKINPMKYILFASQKRLCKILLKICSPGSIEFIRKYLLFLRDFHSFTLDDMTLVCRTNGWVTPLQYVCRQKLYDLLEFFLTLTCVTKRQCLIHNCLEYSLHENQTEIQRRKDMINLLLRTNSKLLDERNNFNDTPLFVKTINLELTKFLVEKGANIHSTDQHGYTIAHKAALLTNADAYHEFISYLVYDLKVAALCKIKNDWGDSLLHLALRYVNSLRVETIQIILNETGLNINDVNKNGENLIFAAVRGMQEIKILELLIRLGADHLALNKDGKSLMYICDQYRFTDIGMYLKSLRQDK